MRTLLNYDFCTVEVYNTYVIFTMFEGILVTPDKNKVLVEIAKKYFKYSNFGYITNRIHSYSVDPNVYFETSKIENLVAVAVVSTKQIDVTNTELEKKFYNKPFRHFIKLESAIPWIENKVTNS